MAQQTSLVIDNQIPGMLSDMISEENQKTVENLKITGYINSTDINFIKTLSKKKTLDLTDVNIIKGGEQIYLYSVYSAGYSYPYYLSITENNVFYPSLFWSFHVDKIATPKALKEENPDAAVRVNADTVILNSRVTINPRLLADTQGRPNYANRVIEIGEGVDSVGILIKDGGGTYYGSKLIIPSTLKKLRSGYYVNFKAFVSRIEHPETLSAEDFYIKGDTLFIPQGTYQRYQSSSVFKDMKVIIELNAPTSISLSATAMKLYVNDFEYLYATTTPSNVYYKELKWESSDESVAVVNQYGEVTAKALGTAEITVSSVQNPEARAKCKVKVCEHVTGIELASAEEIVNIGEPLTLTANTLPLGTTDNEVTWASSDEEIATVDRNGKVTGIKPGNCTIKATAVDGGFEATCNITVVQPATGISVNKQSASILVGASEALTATLTPNDVTDKTILWSSSDTIVAVVSADGVVTARKAGKANIIATAASNPEAKATCEVTAIQPVESITLNETSVTMTQLGEMVKLTSTILPEDASDKSVRWASYNPSVCTVTENGTVVAVGYGTATIVATTVDGGFPAACVVTVAKDEYSSADVNGDGKVDVGDITTIIRIIANKQGKND